MYPYLGRQCCHALECAVSKSSVHLNVDLTVVHAEVEFDFRVPHVSSINCSGHKYGLVYPGVGWVVWRNRACVDESLICEPATVSYILRCMHSVIVSHSCTLLRILSVLSAWQLVYHV